MIAVAKMKVPQLVIATANFAAGCGMVDLFTNSTVEVAAVTANAKATALALAEQRIDVLLLDTCLSDEDGLVAILTQACSLPVPPKVIVTTSQASAYKLAVAIVHGAYDFLSYTSAANEIRRAVKFAAHSELTRANNLIAGMKDVLSDRSRESRLPPLTARETQILQLVTVGLSDAMACKFLRLSSNTIHAHLQNIFIKLRVNGRVSAAVWAVRKGLLDRLPVGSVE